MNTDRILVTLNQHEVDYILIGGMNFMLRHKPVLTFDVDIWVADTEANLAVLSRALVELGAAWGPTEHEWKPVGLDPSWLKRQGCFCLTTQQGALDVFREVAGLQGRYEECRSAAFDTRTPTGIPYRGLSDEHMIECQLALDPGLRNQDRIATLQAAIAQRRASGDRNGGTS